MFVKLLSGEGMSCQEWTATFVTANAAFFLPSLQPFRKYQTHGICKRCILFRQNFAHIFTYEDWEWQWIRIVVSGFLELVTSRAGVGVIYAQIICHACLLVPFSKKILIVIKLIWSCGNIILTKCVSCCHRMLLTHWFLCVVSNLSTVPVKITANCWYQMSLMQNGISPP